MYSLHPCHHDYFIHEPIISTLGWLRSIGWAWLLCICSVVSTLLWVLVIMQSKDLHTFFHSHMPAICRNSSPPCLRSFTFILLPPRPLTSWPMNSLMIPLLPFEIVKCTAQISSNLKNLGFSSPLSLEVTPEWGFSATLLNFGYSWTKLEFFSFSVIWL